MLINFVATTWLLAMLPGVGQALMLRQTLTQGSRVAVATILGTSTGLVVWAAAAGAGLSALVLSEPVVYQGLTWVGGAFLIIIGLRTVRAAFGRREPRLDGPPGPSPGPSPGPGPGPGPANLGCRSAYLAGLLTNLSNPKAAVFAVCVLPAFAGAAAGHFLPTMGLGLIWSAVTATWYLLFVWLVSRGRAMVARPRARVAVDALSGAALIAIGGAVALGI